MEITLAKTSDLAELQQIYYDSRLKHFTWVNQNELELSDFERATEEEQVWVAKKQNDIIGFLSLYEPENFIHLLFIKPGHESQGVGRELLAELVKEAKGNLTLKCLSRNENARKFYEKQGFVIISEGTDEDEGGFYVMEKTIS